MKREVDISMILEPTDKLSGEKRILNSPVKNNKPVRRCISDDFLYQEFETS